MIHFENVSKSYGNGVMGTLQNITLSISRGDFVILSGPSGAGKTSILKLIYHEESPSSGSIFYGDTDISKLRTDALAKYRREIGVVFQDYRLISGQTVFENIAYPLEINVKKNNQDTYKKVLRTLEIVGLQNKVNNFPDELSGGERARVAFARALIIEPKILIADEPLSHLDSDNQENIMEILDSLHDSGITIIVASHNAELTNRKDVKVINIDRGKISK